MRLPAVLRYMVPGGGYRYVHKPLDAEFIISQQAVQSGRVPVPESQITVLNQFQLYTGVLSTASYRYCHVGTIPSLS